MMKYINRLTIGWFIFTFVAIIGITTLDKGSLITFVLFFLIIIASGLILFVSKEEEKKLKEAGLGDYE